MNVEREGQSVCERERERESEGERERMTGRKAWGEDIGVRREEKGERGSLAQHHRLEAERERRGVKR